MSGFCMTIANPMFFTKKVTGMDTRRKDKKKVGNNAGLRMLFLVLHIQ